MKLTKQISMDKLMGVFAGLALILSVTSVSNACFFAFAQPKVPDGLNKFIKNK
ncbi:MAG: cyclic lactone autoinducer peptide [Oscillospiraceae bacterium]|nr:cyclic lactone autoinducer peptide [Oscillospiraceae bacterium]